MYTHASDTNIQYTVYIYIYIHVYIVRIHGKALVEMTLQAIIIILIIFIVKHITQITYNINNIHVIQRVNTL